MSKAEQQLEDLKIFYSDLLKVVKQEKNVELSDVRRLKHIIKKLDNSIKELRILNKR